MRRTYLLGVVAPVPGFDRVRLAFCQRHFAQRRAFGRSARFRRLPDLCQQLGDRGRRTCHAVDQAKKVFSLYNASDKLLLDEPWDYNRLPEAAQDRIVKWMSENMR